MSTCVMTLGCNAVRATASADGGALAEADAGRAPDAGMQADAGAASDAGAAPPDAGLISDARPRPLLPDGGCPPPARITPADLGGGYLAPAQVTLQRTIDGDTAHFNFPDGGPQGLPVRFLYVNTEESYGTRTTEFGVRTSPVISQYLRDATELAVVPQESRARPGTPNFDVYNRMLGLVFVDGELLQTRIVSEGWSAYYTAFGCAPEPIHSALLYAEALARRSAAGIWAVGHPTGYEEVLGEWIGGSSCRPNPYQSASCR